MTTRLAFITGVTLTSACASCDQPRSRDPRPHPPPSERVMAEPRALVVGAPIGLSTLGLGDLCVTSGHVEPAASGWLTVEDAKVRAVASAMTLPVAELRFIYRGHTVHSAPLRSGAMRRQLGLKLRAADGCNVVYIMWRIDPKPGLVVSVKRNPGKTQSSQCGNNGYQEVTPLRAASLPHLAIGSSHVLHAEAHGEILEVTADGTSVWSGVLPAEALTFDGPSGFRTDNVRIDLKLLTAFTGGASPEARCAGPDAHE